jgi:site-specific DNA-methyltransferase (adenine-specific)
MKFDVIVGNPPYQMSDGGAGASAIPVYQKFVEQAKKMNPRYLSMIIPARWFVGGRGLDLFRNQMLNDKRIRVLHDYPNASECFPGVEIKGGVCFFLWEKDYSGDCEIHSHMGEKIIIDNRPLLEDGMETFLRNSTAISILKKTKVKQEQNLSETLHGGRYFGFHTKIDWQDDNSGSIQTADGQSSYPITSVKNNENTVKVYIAHGICWISEKNVTRNNNDIKKFKVIIPRSGNPDSTIIGKPKISEPGSCSSNTYIVFIPENNSHVVAKNIISYLRTRYVRFLISLRTTTQDMPPKAYSFVPIQNFSQPWTDEKLYKKYDLTQDEIAFIESMIRPMEVEEK